MLNFGTNTQYQLAAGQGQDLLIVVLQVVVPQVVVPQVVVLQVGGQALLNVDPQVEG